MWYFKNNMELSLETIKKMTTKEYLENRREIQLFLKPIRDNKIKEEKLEKQELLLKKKLELFNQALENDKKINDYRKNYYLKNKEKIRKYHRALYLYKKQLKLEKILKNRLLNNLRSRLSHALQRNSKSSRTMEYLGCTLKELKNYLESQFIEGMNWENYGKWHIDHIKPCASFDLNIIEEQHKCFHFSNLQPLWAKDNLSKNDNY